MVRTPRGDLEANLRTTFNYCGLCSASHIETLQRSVSVAPLQIFNIG